MNYYFLLFSELKRRLKAEQRAKEKAEKEKLKAPQDNDQLAAKKNSEVEKINEDDISPNVRSNQIHL